MRIANEFLLNTTLAIFFLLGVYPQEVWACKCSRGFVGGVGDGQPDYVFIGEVEEKRNNFSLSKRLKWWWYELVNIEPTEEMMFSYEYFGVTYTFKVLNTLKGRNISRIAVWTGQGGPDCGAVFKKNMIYQVYANSVGGGFETNRCLPNRIIGSLPRKEQ